MAGILTLVLAEFLVAVFAPGNLNAILGVVLAYVVVGIFIGGIIGPFIAPWLVPKRLIELSDLRGKEATVLAARLQIEPYDQAAAVRARTYIEPHIPTDT